MLTCGYTCFWVLSFISPATCFCILECRLWVACLVYGSRKGQFLHFRNAELYLRSKKRTYSAEFHCRDVPPQQTEDLQCGISLRSCTSAVKQGPTAWNFTVELYTSTVKWGPTAWNFTVEPNLHGETKWPPAINLNFSIEQNFTSELDLHSEMKSTCPLRLSLHILWISLWILCSETQKIN